MAALEARRAANLRGQNAVMEDLCANGYLRARMVRARLLHYFVARLVGARPFCNRTVPPQHHMKKAGCARMVRARLLYCFIARVVGARPSATPTVYP